MGNLFIGLIPQCCEMSPILDKFGFPTVSVVLFSAIVEGFSSVKQVKISFTLFSCLPSTPVGDLTPDPGFLDGFAERLLETIVTTMHSIMKYCTAWSSIVKHREVLYSVVK